MTNESYVVHCPMGTFNIAFAEDGTKEIEAIDAVKTYLEMAMLGKYTPEGFALTFTTLTPDALMAMDNGNIVVIPPFDEVLREVISVG